jgi:hypothetical protein
MKVEVLLRRSGFQLPMGPPLEPMPLAVPRQIHRGDAGGRKEELMQTCLFSKI